MTPNQICYHIQSLIFNDSFFFQAIVLNVTGRPLPAKDKDDGKSHSELKIFPTL